jgi:hypothetical protein
MPQAHKSISSRTARAIQRNLVSTPPPPPKKKKTKTKDFMERPYENLLDESQFKEIDIYAYYAYYIYIYTI